MPRGWVGSVLVVACLGMVGCSSPQEAEETLPKAPSPASAEPTLEPLGPVDFPVPDEAREQTEAGAIAMATYYLDLVDYARPSLDGDMFLGLSEACETCEQMAAGFAVERGLGNRYEGGDITIDTVGTVVLSGPSADLTLTMRQAPARLIGPDDQEILDRATGELRLSGGMVLAWSSVRQGWLVAQLNAERY